MSIPIIDLAHLNSPNPVDVQQIVSLIRDAAMSSGFFYIKNHGVDPSIVERQFNLAKRLFDLPDHVKQKYDQKHNFSYRGFEQIAAQKSDIYAKADLKEGFYCGKNYAEDDPFVVARYQNYGLNQWPAEEVPETESYCQEYIELMNSLCEQIMQLLALSLDLPQDYFEKSCINPMVTLRLLKYPPHPKDADENTFGAGAHTDWGSVTILAQDDLGGLEVCLPDGTWIEAKPIENTFVVNLGDLIPRWTNGLYNSNPHRVRNKYSEGQPRFSIPYFYGPSYLTIIEPLPGTLKQGEQAKFNLCTAGEHMEEMYRRTFDVKTEDVPEYTLA